MLAIGSDDEGHMGMEMGMKTGLFWGKLDPIVTEKVVIGMIAK